MQVLLDDIFRLWLPQLKLWTDQIRVLKVRFGKVKLIFTHLETMAAERKCENGKAIEWNL